MRYFALAWGAVLSVFLSAPPGLEGQSVRGTVLDEQTEAPVEGATVTLLDRDRKIVDRTLSESDGAFHLVSDQSGRFLLHVDRIGYAESTTPPLDLRENEELQVQVHVSVEAVPVAPLTIVSPRPALLRSSRLEFLAFYERKKRYGREGLGSGQFLERADIERMSPVRLTDALTNLHGIRVRSSGRRRSIRMRHDCEPDVFVDGIPVRLRQPRGIDLELDDLGISPLSVEGIEVYYGRVRPARFIHFTVHDDYEEKLRCGAIVIWTGSR